MKQGGWRCRGVDTRPHTMSCSNNHVHVHHNYVYAYYSSVRMSCNWELEKTTSSSVVYWKIPDYSKEYGINYRTSLMDLKYFDPCSGGLVPDVMHDVLEGVLQREVKLILQHCVNSMKYFRLTQLNGIMEFGYMEVTNRPTPIQRKTLHSTDYSLQQNGTCTCPYISPLRVIKAALFCLACKFDVFNDQQNGSSA